jgi:hypothetical protein
MPPHIRFTFEQVMRQVKAKYVVGLTATPTRKDGHHPIIYMQCGPVRFSMSAKTMTETTPFEHKVTPRHTEFRMAPELTEVTIQDIYAALVNDASRNEMIAADIVRAIRVWTVPAASDRPDRASPVFRSQACRCRQARLRLEGRHGKKAASGNSCNFGGGARERIEGDSRDGKLHWRRV